MSSCLAAHGMEFCVLEPGMPGEEPEKGKGKENGIESHTVVS